MNYQSLIEDLQDAQNKKEKYVELRKFLDDNKSKMSFTLYATMVDLIKLEQPDSNMLQELMMASLNFQPTELHKKNMQLQFKLNEMEKDYNDNLILLDHTEGERDDALSDKEDYERQIKEMESTIENLQEELDSQSSIDHDDLETYIDETKSDIVSEVENALESLFSSITDN
jgi:chromosome segregation ATPase